MDADHISLLGSAAVTDTGRLWTTDRGVSMSAGHAVTEEGSVDQATWGASVWPRSGHDSAAAAGQDGLHLLYQDGDALAGRTRASVTRVGSQLRLRYDRVYNGPHKLGSTARHVVNYLAMKGGEQMRPAVGAVPLPGPAEQLQVNCGFEPAMIEVTLSGAPLGEEVSNWSTPQPLGWSEGTAITDEAGLRQYVLHHAYTPAPQAGAAGAGAAASGEEATADGGATPDGGRQSTQEGRTDQDTEGTVPADGMQAGTAEEVPSGASQPPVETPAEVPRQPTGPESDAVPEEPVAQTPEAADTGEEPYRVQPPTEAPDDGIVGLSLLQDDEGTVCGRDECSIAAVTEYGFDVTVNRVDTDGQGTLDHQPTLIYRAWPAVDGREGPQSEEAPEGQHQTSERQPDGQPGVGSQSEIPDGQPGVGDHSEMPDGQPDVTGSQFDLAETQPDSAESQFADVETSGGQDQ